MHLQAGELHAYLDRELARAEMERISLHLSACPSCQERFQAIETRARAVEARLDRLAPASERGPMPVNTARKRLDALREQSQMEVFPMLKHLFSRRTRPFWAVLAVIAILAVSLAVPSVRAIANNFLGLFRVQQFSVIQVDENQVEVTARRKHGQPVGGFVLRQRDNRWRWRSGLCCQPGGRQPAGRFCSPHARRSA